MSSGPTVSVIIPTHNRVASLMRTVRAFDRQTVAAEQMELIVVADGCSDATGPTLTSQKTRCSLKLLTLDGRGAAAARNRGAEAAEGSILLFMDDDVEPSQTLVEAHIGSHTTRPGRLVLGPYPYSLRGPSTFYHMRARAWWQAHFAEVARWGHRFDYRDVVSGNMSLSAKLFGQLGGFNTAIRGAGGEDYEFGARVIKAGVEIAFEPAAQAVHHQHETMTLIGSLQRAEQEGHVNVIMGRLHPDVRVDLFGAMEDAGEGYHRHLRRLVFRTPWLGRLVAWLTLQTMPVLEFAKMRWLWRKAVGALHGLWYWRGVAEEIGSEKALLDMGQAAEREGAKEDAHEVDLAVGLEVVERELDAKRPASLRLRFGERELGEIEPVALAEPLRGAHLRPYLAESLAHEVFLALAMRGTILAEAHPQHSLERA